MRAKNWVRLFIALLLYIPLYFVQNAIDCRRKIEDLETGLLLMPGHQATSLILGGFKGLAADLLWLNIEEYWHSGQHYKLLPLLESIAWLQPTYITVWAVGGWHMAYNIFAQVEEPASQWKEMIKKESESMSDAEKKKYARVLEAADAGSNAIKTVRENGPAKGIAELLEELKAKDDLLEAFRTAHGPSRLVDAAQGLVRIVPQQVRWYREGIRFLKKGIASNPEKYDLYFELAWTYYHKGKEYPEAVRYFEKAVQFSHPAFVDDCLAHAYEKNGQIGKAIEQWEYVLKTYPEFKNVAERMLHNLRTKGKATP